MVRRTKTASSKRYDGMIGYLVAFEKRAKTMEVCCDLQNDAIISIESNSSSTSSASCVRHAGSIKRSHRGRTRKPAPKPSENGTSNSSAEKVKMAEDVICVCDTGGVTINKKHSKTNQTSEQMIITALDVVEVVISCNEPDDQENLWTSHPPVPELMLASFTVPLHQHVKCENASGTPIDNFDSKKVSSTSSTVSAAKHTCRLGNGIYNGEELIHILSNDLSHTAHSQKLDKTSILQPISILKERQHVEITENEFFREAQTKQKVLGVAFREPIHDVIPSKKGSISPYNCVYRLGDHVEITDGIYRRQIGRIVKTLGDIVQVEVDSRKPKFLYISPNMLQPLHGPQIFV